MDKLDAALVEMAGQVTALAAKHGPEMVGAAALVMQVTAVKTLIIAAAFLFIGIPLSACGMRLNGGWIKTAPDNEKGWHVFWWFFCATAAASCLIGGLMHFADPINWYAANNPHFAIAAKALGKL